MGLNAGYKDNLFTGIFAFLSLILSIIAFTGAGKFVGFLNEEIEEKVFGMGVLGFLESRSVERYLHLSIVPTTIALLLAAIERFPTAGKRMKTRTLSPMNLALLTFVNYAIQLLPAIFGFDVSPTWLSDFMADHLFIYVLFTLILIITIASGLFFATMAWVYDKSENKAILKEFLFSLGVGILSIIAWTGFGKFEGFLAKHDVSSPDDYVNKHGWIKFFIEGPIIDYAHLTSVPALVGLVVLIYHTSPMIFQKLVGKANKKRRRKKKPDNKHLGRLGKFTFFVILIQLAPAIVGLNISPTWLSDLIMIDLYGYAFLTSGVLFGMFLGLYRAITGGILHQRDYG